MAALVDPTRIKHNVGVLILARCVCERGSCSCHGGEEQCARYVSICVCVRDRRRISLAAAKKDPSAGGTLPSKLFRFFAPHPPDPPPRSHWLCRPGMGSCSRAERPDCSPVLFRHGSSSETGPAKASIALNASTCVLCALARVYVHVCEGVLTPISAR